VEQGASSLWIGLISGTSADSIDAALVRIGVTPGEFELLAHREMPLGEDLRRSIHEIGEAPVLLRDLVALDVRLGALFGEAALAVAEQAGIDPADIEGIGSHGQTVGHYPEPETRGTLQIADPSVIHARTGIPVIADFRAADLAAGGQGAPLTPFLHYVALARESEARAVLNIGGFTNLTYLPASARAEELIAFDPGPGNALLDRVARWASKGVERFDRDGALAGSGEVCEPVLEALLEDPYFAQAPPKSTGHEHFGASFFEAARDAILARGRHAQDVAATLAALTVESVVRALDFLPEQPRRWILYGGGVFNPWLMERLRARLAPALLETSDQHGLPAAALEAVAFAVLGYCGARGITSNLPAATGATRAVVLGCATPPGSFTARS
jgi:anhydro-N-acetylmuramic acid kinase